jgi:adenylate kinase family enzyme
VTSTEVSSPARRRPSRRRLGAHQHLQDTVPVVDYYRERGILAEIDGTQDIDAVASAIEAQLEAAVC